MKQGGIMGGESIFILAIVCMGVFGVYKYVAAETSSYTLIQENTNAMQNEIKSLGSVIDNQNEKLRNQQAQLNEVVKQLTEVTDIASGAVQDAESAHEHLARVREMQQSVKPVVFPKTFLVELVAPKAPIPIRVLKKDTISQTKKSVRKTKTGYDSRSETRTGARKKTLPGTSAAKKAMKKAKL